ncbi:MAG: hypothetical protein HYY84_06975 [Deltaproteobacteria bacterium]|nr:hypothetical protein [Deltaproteobacteria bacterium]
MVGRRLNQFVVAMLFFVPAIGESASKAKNKGKGMEAEFVRMDAKGNLTIGKGRTAGVVKGCAVFVSARLTEVNASKGTAVIFLAKPVAAIKKARSIDLVCGKAKVKASVVGVVADREQGARVTLGGLKGKKVDKECAHTFLLGRVERVYESASAVPTSVGDAIATQKSFWVECR